MSVNKVFLNDYLRSYQEDADDTQRFAKAGIEFAISIPAFAFRVVRRNKVGGGNVLKNAIRGLKTLGLDEESIAKSLNINERLVVASLEEDANRCLASSSSESEEETYFYLFYDLLGKRFLKYGVTENDYNMFTCNEVTENGLKFDVRKSIGVTDTLTVCPIKVTTSIEEGNVPIPSELIIKNTYIRKRDDGRSTYVGYVKGSGQYTGVKERVELVCHYYYNSRYTEHFFVSNPIVREQNNQALTFEIMRLVKEQNSVQKLNPCFFQEVQRLEERVKRFHSRPKVDDAEKRLAHIFDYSELGKYEKLHGALSTLEKSYMAMKETPIGGASERNDDVLSKFLFASFTAIEEILKATLTKAGDEDECIIEYAKNLFRGKGGVAIGGVSRKIFDGYSFKNIERFCAGVDSRNVIGAFMLEEDRPHRATPIRDLIVASAIIANHSRGKIDFSGFSSNYPSFLNDCLTLYPLRNTRGHDSQECKEACERFRSSTENLHDEIIYLIRVLLKIKLGNGNLGSAEATHLVVDKIPEKQAKQNEIKALNLGTYEEKIRTMWNEFYDRDLMICVDSMRVIEQIFSDLGRYCWKKFRATGLNKAIYALGKSNLGALNGIADEFGSEEKFRYPATSLREIKFEADITDLVSPREGGGKMNIRPKIATIIECLYLNDRDTLAMLFERLPGWIGVYEELNERREHSYGNYDFGDDSLCNKLTDFAREAKNFVDLK